MIDRVWIVAQSLAVASAIAVVGSLATLPCRVVLRRRVRTAHCADEILQASAAESAPRDLEAWIDEVEREDHAPALASGSEAWWRAYAAGGGSLPETADSGRRHEAAASAAPAAFARRKATSADARGVA